ncbi:MAG: tripartite tricarboxylate transporter substrate-binding protein [Pseudomonadales bacterium]
MKKISTLVSAVIASSCLMLGTAQAQYPEKPVSIVVPFPPGDLEDVTSRMIANTFQDMYKVPAAVINKPGGGGGPFPGAVSVAKAKPDGTTIGSFVMAVPLVGPQIGIPELSPNPFEPIGLYMTYPFVIAASKDAPYQSLEEMAAYAKDNKLILGHFGAPLIPSKVSIALADKMGFEWASDAGFDALDCNTLASGDVDVINTTLQLILPCLDKVNVLAAVTEERINKIPDVRTVGELFPELKIGLWNGIFVHKDTPQEARDKIAAAVKQTALGEQAQQLSVKTGAQVYWKDAKQADAQLKTDAQTIANLEALLNN